MVTYFLFVPVYLKLYGHFNYKMLLDEGTEEDRADLEKYFFYFWRIVLKLVPASSAAKVILNAARAQMGKLRENFQVYGTQREKWIPQLLQAIPRHILRRKYGGTNDNVEIQRHRF